LGFLPFLDPLVEPTFIDREKPPVPLNIPAKVIGLISAILSALSLLGYLIAIPAVLLIATAQQVFGVAIPGTTHSGVLIIALVGLAVGLAADLMTLVGGWQMFNGSKEGKTLVIYGLVIGFAGSIIFNIGFATYGAGLIFGLIITAIVYYLVVISRFPDEAPLSTGSSSTPPPEPPMPPAPPTT
jgi:uncharacterized protein YqgC (DUF456 family)